MALNLPNGTECFVDTNIFVYHFVQLDVDLSNACRAFLRRVVIGEIKALVTVQVLADVIHKVMAEEARKHFGLSSGGVPYLQRHPEKIADLSVFVSAAEQLKKIPLQVLSVDFGALSDAVSLSQTHGLLTNAATIVALMHRHGITHLATNDDDFDRLPGITVWKPRP
jgi:predicted nucleic acid-binding protein